MAGPAAPIATDRSGARGCLSYPLRQRRRRCAPAARDRLAPSQRATEPAARQRPRPDAENFGGEVSFRYLPLWSVYSITSSALASSDAGTVRPSIVAVSALMTSSNLVDCTTGKSAGLAPLRMRPA